MTRRSHAAVATVLIALLGVAGGADAQTQAQCTAALTTHAPKVPAGADACLTLATMVAGLSPAVVRASDEILKPDAVPVARVFTARDLQARNPQQPATAGTPAQGQAIPDVQPAALASGSIAAIGTDAGTDAIAALSVNPSLLFIGDEASRRLAQYSRFFDLTFFVPVSRTGLNGVPAADSDGTPKYYGARLRVNVNGVSNGGQVWDQARQLLTQWIARGGRNLARVRDLFREAPNLEACVAALMADPAVPVAVESDCGSAFELEVNLAEATELRQQFARVRRAADAEYFGMDIRFDKGDPTLGAVENASGTYLFGGLAYGRRLSDTADRSGGISFRVRVGARHAKLDSTDEVDFAGEGGAGFELARQVDDLELNASIGLEFRYGNGPSALRDQFQTDYAMVRGSVSIPMTSANSLSINVGVPLAGNVSPALGVNFNWGLLLSNAPARPGQ